ncbi:MAG: hypothetical protein LLF97_06890 [Planctomycetaceae bacterium]|nr:hypothetical protein [Planctomycetaceae bacterium]
MPRFWMSLVGCIGCLLLVHAVRAADTAEKPAAKREVVADKAEKDEKKAAAPTKPAAKTHESRPSETLLPGTTQGFLAISNVDVLSEHWNKTQLGHLMADPVMKPFSADIRRQIEDRWSSIHDRLGITLEDMKGVPGGDVAIALISPAPGKAALAIVVDVFGKRSQAEEMLEKVTATQLKRGAKRSELKHGDVAVVQFDLPQREEEMVAAQSTLRGSEKSEAAKAKNTDKKNDAEEAAPRRAFYCLTGDLLVVADNVEVLFGIVDRAADGKSEGSLATQKAFQKVTTRCLTDHKGDTPQIRWFIHPLGYAEAARAATPADRRRKGKSILEIMRKQGLDALQGIGGYLDFAAEGYEMVHRTAVYAPPPYKKSMKMLSLPNQTDFSPQPWVPRDIATYTTLYFDILNAFDNFGPLFDEFVAQGDEGTWTNDVLPGLKDDPNGPQIDLRKDLIAHLGQRVSVLTDYRLPITTTSERLLFAIETKNPKAVAKAIEKLMKNDPTIKRQEINGQVVWEIVEEEPPADLTAPVVTLDNVPVVAPAHPIKKHKKSKDDDEEEDKEQRLLPHAAFTVWQGNLLIASHLDFLQKVISPAKKPELLRQDVDYRLVDEEIARQQPKEKCLRTFSRTDEEYRPTYELIRQNKMRESEGLMVRLLNGLFGEGKKGDVRTQRIDGRQLPDYQVVRRYLNPAGFQATSEPDGWFLKGFTLTKDNEK